MILIEKEWQDYKDSKALYKIEVLALFLLLLNIGVHIYNFVLAKIEAGYSLDFIYILDFSLSWGEILRVFNISTVVFFLPIVVLTNVGSVSKTKLKNAHFFATGVSREAMGFVKIGMRIFVPIVAYCFVSVIICAIANFVFDNDVIVIGGYNLSLGIMDLYVRPAGQIPFMLMCISIALLAEQLGRDRLISIFLLFMGLLALFAVMGLSTIVREAIAEVYNYVFFASATINAQSYILGQLMFLCIFTIAFTLSVIRFSRNKRI